VAAAETQDNPTLAVQGPASLGLAHLVDITIMAGLELDIKGLEIMEVAISILAKALNIDTSPTYL